MASQSIHTSKKISTVKSKFYKSEYQKVRLENPELSSYECLKLVSERWMKSDLNIKRKFQREFLKSQGRSIDDLPKKEKRPKMPKKIEKVDDPSEFQRRRFVELKTEFPNLNPIQIMLKIKKEWDEK